jgi:hypothetical protein
MHENVVSTMPKRKAVDHAKLAKIVHYSAAQADIMKKLGIGTATQLKVAVVDQRKRVKRGMRLK